VGHPPASGALTFGRSFYYGYLALLPAVPSALEKLQNLGLTVDEANEIIRAPETQALVDNRNGGNINFIVNMGGQLIRITTDPAGQRIISAGLVRAYSIANGIASGRFSVK